MGRSRLAWGMQPGMSLEKNLTYDLCRKWLKMRFVSMLIFMQIKSISYERFYIKAHFETEAQGNSDITHKVIPQ